MDNEVQFLIYSTAQEEVKIDVVVKDETIWLTQKSMAELFGVESNTITYHLREIFKSGELERNSTTRKFRVVQKEGNRSVNREIEHYNLDAIISVGYRVNSIRATQFRRWATQVLRTYTIQGYVMDRKRLVYR